jgi:hypothetical protein
MPLTSRDLRPADIIVSTTNAGVSTVIRSAIGSSVSHCILYVGGSNVVEAIDRGVVNNPLDAALSHATLAIVLRRRNLTAKQRSDVVTAANGFVSKNLPYDALGAAGAGVYTRRGLALGMVACRVLMPFCPVATVVGVDNAKPENADTAFFCSELVARCFELAGAPIVEGAATNQTPRHIRVATTLLYIGKIKDTPVEPAGIATGAPL